MLGPAPIVDFDGTLALLEVEWDRVRADLDVSRVSALWATDGAGWSVVEEAEVSAATTAARVETVAAALVATEGFAVLTDNGERAVHVFLDRFPELASRVVAVVGRETLGGPKRDPETFRRGFALCRTATEARRAGGAVVYVGDQAYELDLARSEGAEAYDAASLTTGEVRS